MADIDYTKGFDDEMQVVQDTPAVEITTTIRPKRRPYASWDVSGNEYKLKLTAQDITKLEQKYRRNLLLYLTDDGIPAVADMLTVIQAAMRTYHHGMSFLSVQELFDKYVEDGGDQSSLMAEVLMPLLSVSGFFTPSQEETLTAELKNLDTNL